MSSSPPDRRMAPGFSQIATALKRGANLPEFGEQHDVEHLAQVPRPAGAAGAALEADDPLHRGDVVEAPAAEIVLEIDQLLGELIDLPMRRRFAVDRFPGREHGGVLLPGRAPLATRAIASDRKAA